MSLTKKQKNVLVNVLLACLVFCVVTGVCWAAVSVITRQPAQAQPHVPSVNASRYEQVQLGNSDGTVDHFCAGSTGIWYGPNSSDFTVEAGDPLCR